MRFYVETKVWNCLFQYRNKEKSRTVGEEEKKNPKRGQCNDLIYSKYKGNEKFILITFQFIQSLKLNFLFWFCCLLWVYKL